MSRVSTHEPARVSWTMRLRPSMSRRASCYVQHDMLMAEPFDADRLRLGGRAVLLSRGITAPSLAEGSVVSASRDLLAFRAGASQQQLTWVDRSGVPQGSLEVPTPMFNFRVSPDGQFVLAASSLTDATGVWLVDLASRHSTQLAADGIAPLWSPDGRRVAFTSRAGLDLHVRPSVGGARLEPLISDQSVKVLNDWSAHAQRSSTRDTTRSGKLDLWHVPLAGGDARPLLNGAFNEAQARISPDGRWLAYVADGTRYQEVYVRRYPELDAPRQVSNGGGGQPQWRADQRELFYLSPDRSLMAASVIDARDVSFGAPRRLFRTSIVEGPAAARDSCGRHARRAIVSDRCAPRLLDRADHRDARLGRRSDVRACPATLTSRHRGGARRHALAGALLAHHVLPVALVLGAEILHQLDFPGCGRPRRGPRPRVVSGSSIVTS